MSFSKTVVLGLLFQATALAAGPLENCANVPCHYYQQKTIQSTTPPVDTGLLTDFHRAQQNALKKADLQVKTATEQALAALLAASDKNVSNTSTAMARRTASDFPYVMQSQFGSTIATRANTSALQSGNQMLNVRSLLGPVRYAQSYPQSALPNTHDSAMNFVFYLSGLAYPYPTLSVDLLAAANKNQNQTPDQLLMQPKARDFRLALRTWSSMKSVALDTLLHAYYARQPVPGLTVEGIQGDVSPLQVQEQMAAHRTSPDWISNMSTATEAAVQKEILYALSDLVYQNYQKQRQAERTNVLLATLVMQNNMQFREFVLNQLKPGGKGAGTSVDPQTKADLGPQASKFLSGG